MPKTRRPGGWIAREDRYEETGMTTTEREAEIARLNAAGFSQGKIAKRLGISQAGVHYTLKRLRGEQRNRAIYEMCEWCGENVPKGELDENGSCVACREL